MNLKLLPKFDRSARINTDLNYLDFYELNHLGSLQLKKKRVLAFILKKIMKFSSYDKELIQLQSLILHYFFSSYDSEKEQSENELLIILDQIVIQFNDSDVQDELLKFYQFFMTKKKKYKNIFYYLCRLIGLMQMFAKPQKQIEHILENQQYKYLNQNNPNFMLFINHFTSNNPLGTQNQDLESKNNQQHIENNGDQLNQLIQDNSILNVDLILQRVQQMEKNESDSVVEFLRQNIEKDYPDIYLLKKKYFLVAFSQGEQFNRDEIVKFYKADVFDQEYVEQILKSINICLSTEEEDDELIERQKSSLILEIIKSHLQFSRGSTYIWKTLFEIIQKSINSTQTPLFNNEEKEEFFQIQYSFWKKQDIVDYQNNKSSGLLIMKTKVLQKLFPNQKITFYNNILLSLQQQFSSQNP